MATFVLVPGYWLGAWAWDEVAAELRAAGHRAVPVTLTGLAERAGEATPEVDLDVHVADVVAAVEDAVRGGGSDGGVDGGVDGGDGRVVLVAHSGGAMPVTGAADRIPGRVARIVYVDTGPMPSGMANIDFHEPEGRAELERQVAGEGAGWLLPVPPFAPGEGDGPGEDAADLAGLTQEHLAALRERGTPQPFGTVTQPLERPDPLPATPRTLIATSIPLEAVRAMAEGGHPVFALMAGPGWTHRSLPTGHWPMFSRPRELAALLAAEAGGTEADETAGGETAGGETAGGAARKAAADVPGA
ncbi:alpha/beta fold hydrolase [Actinomadura sediminis]|uniref:Alpha/beta fold hydrolase n=1 Tax=Actinomadura sediminis TaxID=1038904 RepID=A0ABW3F386_9ACTN